MPNIRSGPTEIQVPATRRADVNGLDGVRVLLNDSAGRRFVAEFLVVGLGIAALTAAGGSVLNAAFPELFPAGTDGFSRYDWPDTRLEGVQALVVTVVLGTYFYWRLFHTELGMELRTLAEEELASR